MFYKRKHYNLSACAHTIFLLLCLSPQVTLPSKGDIWMHVTETTKQKKISVWINQEVQLGIRNTKEDIFLAKK